MIKSGYYIQENKTYGKKYDRGQHPQAPDHLRRPIDSWQPVPADLQCGGLHHCGPIHRKGGFGGGGDGQPGDEHYHPGDFRDLHWGVGSYEQFFRGRAGGEGKAGDGHHGGVWGVFSIVIVVLGIGLTKPLLRALYVPEEILGIASLYLKIIFLGAPFTFFYNAIASALKSVGDSKTPLKFLAFCSVLNGALDVIFIGGFILGLSALPSPR